VSKAKDTKIIEGETMNPKLMAAWLDETATDERHNEAAAMIRRLDDIAAVAREVVVAKTYTHSKSAYAELVDLIKGKKND
jgi:hypothetical protein